MQPEREPTALDTVVAYHERTKHRLDRLARSLGYLDWATQPDPFRRFDGAPVRRLDEVPPGPQPAYGALYDPAARPAAPLERAAVSQLFYDSLALSAWKAYGRARWSLRVNPSSGNLHPTEGYLVCGPVPGLTDAPGVYHYAPYPHALEQRRGLAPEDWAALADGLPAGAVLVGLTSITWREAWKYGERAFRYCQHDAGHAIAAVTLAAAALGWAARLLEGAGDDDRAVLLGTHVQSGPEAEQPEALLALYPATHDFPHAAAQRWRPPADVLARLREAPPAGTPNRLSSEHHPWPIIDAVHAATVKPASPATGPEAPGPAGGGAAEAATPRPPDAPAVSARRIIRQRRSAVAMDGETGLSREAFFAMLARTLPAAGRPPFAALSWPPMLHLALFVHRVRGLAPGVYALVRDPEVLAPLRAACHEDFAWTRPAGCPAHLPLYTLLETDPQRVAEVVCCRQAIAADGAFALGMIAAFEPALAGHGPWFYRRLHWEAGAIGQVLYLEAEAAGVRSTGIGCFFDDVVHEILGLADRRFQTLYHFTVGGAVDDSRLRTLEPYAHLHGESA